MNLTAEVVYKRGQDYRFACYDRGRPCQGYRVRFLCGKPGKQPLAADRGSVLGAGGHVARAWLAGSAAPSITVTGRSCRACDGEHFCDTEAPQSWQGQQPCLPICLSGRAGPGPGALAGSGWADLPASPPQPPGTRNQWPLRCCYFKPSSQCAR